MGVGLFLLITGAVTVYSLYSLFADNREDPPPSHPQPPPPHIPRRPPAPPPHIPRRPPSPSPHIPTWRPLSPSPHIPSRRRDDRQHRQTIDSSQVHHLPVETYASLRARARQEGELNAQSIRQSKEAHKRHEHDLARKLSDQGKRHALKMKSLNAQASAIIFKENNQDKPACEVDLHGLHVKEAISYSEKALKKARQRGDSEIRLIVGRGKHSDGGIPRLKPAIKKAMQTRGVHVDVDPKNPGVLLLVI